MNEKLIGYQKAFLLLQLLGAEQKTLTKGVANKAFKGKAKKSLDLDAKTANGLRDSLVNEGYVEIFKKGKSACFRLTERGEAFLLEQEQYPKELVIPGRVINALLNAVREHLTEWQAGPSAGKPERGNSLVLLDKLEQGIKTLFQSARNDLSISQPGSVQEPAVASAVEPEKELLPKNFAEQILGEFEEMRQEHYSHTGLVPIHEIRRRMAEKFGPRAARHDVLDPQIQLLRQQQRIRMVPISDLRDATREQLNDSIPGVNETLFYLEPAHEQSFVR